MEVVTPIPWLKVSGMTFIQSYSVPKYEYGKKDGQKFCLFLYQRKCQAQRPTQRTIERLKLSRENS